MKGATDGVRGSLTCAYAATPFATAFVRPPGPRAGRHAGWLSSRSRRRWSRSRPPHERRPFGLLLGSTREDDDFDESG